MKKLTNWIYFIAFACISECASAQQFNDPVPVHDSITIQSVMVGELRTINVWLPPNYKAGADSFAVMYMPDGGILEDFPHIANTFASLIEAGKILPVILVGIENTKRRRDLTGPTQVKKDKKIAPVVGGSAEFRSFINNELFPEINKRYRTTKIKGILGESLAGLFIIETLFLQPQMFDYYIAFDPSLWWNNHFLVQHAKDYISKFPVIEKRLWFAGSGTPEISLYTNELAKILQAESFHNFQWMYSDEPKEEHSTIFRATKEKAIIWTLNGK